MRKLLITAAGCLVLLGAPSGCFSYDAAIPGIQYQNNLDETVVITIKGYGDSDIRDTLSSGHSGVNPQTECYGTAIVVETENGDPVGRVDQAACPGWMLTINEDGTLTYAEL